MGTIIKDGNEYGVNIGHIIENTQGNDLPERVALQFSGAEVTDDAVNDRTVIAFTGRTTFAYIVGSTAFASNWLSETVGGLPLIPKTNQLYLVLTAGDYLNCIYRFDSTDNEYVSVSSSGGGSGGQTIQVEELPTASLDLVGTVYQYIGATTVNYTHNYFYECFDNGGGTYEWRNVNVSPGEKLQFAVLPAASAALAGEIYQYVGTTTSTYTNGYFYECYETSTTGVYDWRNVNVSPGEKTQYDIFPTASSALVGSVYQYLGTTDSNYTNGYFYKCVEDTSTTPSTYSWKPVQVQDGTISRELTQAEYDLLPEEEKNDGTVYYIDDGASPLMSNSAACGFTPIGTVISVMGNYPPKNFLVCNGDVLNITNYPELANYFEDQFGSKSYFGGDGITTFAVPDLRGEFLRGTGTNSHTNQGDGASVGAHQDGTVLPNVAVDTSVNHVRFPKIRPDSEYSANFDTVSSDTYQGTYTGNSVSAAAGLTTLITSRPTNTSVLYCIAYKNIYVNTLDAGSDYSYEESVVGRWVDGKPLYQKTIADIAMTASGWTNLYLFENAENLYIVHFSYYIPASPSETMTGSATNVSFSFDPVTHYLKYYRSNTSFQYMLKFLTVQYTKTTD